MTGDELLNLRKALGLSIKEMAKEINVPMDHYEKYEKNIIKINPNLERIFFLMQQNAENIKDELEESKNEKEEIKEIKKIKKSDYSIDNWNKKEKELSDKYAVKLKNLRKALGLSQKKFGDLYGIDQHYISGFERKKYKIPHDLMDFIDEKIKQNNKEYRMKRREENENKTNIEQSIQNNKNNDIATDNMKNRNIIVRPVENYNIPKIYKYKDKNDLFHNDTLIILSIINSVLLFIILLILLIKFL